MKVEEAGYMDTLPLVSRYLRHVSKTVQEAILVLDAMPVGLEVMMSAALHDYLYSKHVIMVHDSDSAETLQRGDGPRTHCGHDQALHVD